MWFIVTDALSFILFLSCISYDSIHLIGERPVINVLLWKFSLCDFCPESTCHGWPTCTLWSRCALQLEETSLCCSRSACSCKLHFFCIREKIQLETYCRSVTGRLRIRRQLCQVLWRSLWTHPDERTASLFTGIHYHEWQNDKWDDLTITRWKERKLHAIFRSLYTCDTKG